MKRTKLFT